MSSASVMRRGKVPPVDSFTGESNDLTWEDWLPTLMRAATWNEWSEEVKLLQLAGYLRVKALQEWNLISTKDCSSFELATAKLQEKLDHGIWKLAAQGLRHAIQSP